nr:MAG TPA: hypothetical protein [Caudoviricetes sp.]
MVIRCLQLPVIMYLKIKERRYIKMKREIIINGRSFGQFKSCRVGATPTYLYH